MKKHLLIILNLVSFIAFTVAADLHDEFKAGTIAKSQTIDYMTSPATITGTRPTGGTGTYSYQWEISTDGQVWRKVTGATGVSYTPSKLTVNTYYRRVDSDGATTMHSNVVTISIRRTKKVG